MRSRILLSTILVVTALLLSSNCNQKTALTFGLPSITGVAEYYAATPSDPAHVEADVEVDGTRLVPVVAINNDTLDLDGFSGQGEYMWASQWSDAKVKVAADAKYQLNVYQSDGTATSDKLALPAALTITSPADTSRLARGSALTVSWSGGSGVDRFEVFVYIDYEYLNSNGYYDYFYLDTTIRVGGSTTSITIPAATIFPPDVDTVEYGSGQISVSAEAGPDIGHTSSGNIHGNGLGYFWTRAGDDHEIYFGGGPLPEAGARDKFRTRLSAKEVLDQKLAALRQMN